MTSSLTVVVVVITTNLISQSRVCIIVVFFNTNNSLTINLFFFFAGKVFSITYIRLKFQSSRPESFAIYKKTNEDGQWIPYQYYSASCEETYNRPKRDIITRDDETKAICTDVYSDISPLTGGGVVFSTLEGRPSAYNFENSPVLQVRYYDIMEGSEGMSLVAEPNTLFRNGTGQPISSHQWRVVAYIPATFWTILIT